MSGPARQVPLVLLVCEPLVSHRPATVTLSRPEAPQAGLTSRPPSTDGSPALRERPRGAARRSGSDASSRTPAASRLAGGTGSHRTSLGEPHPAGDRPG